MYNVTAHITITQRPSDQWPNRTRTFALEFFEGYEWESSWEELTDKGSITLPKNLKVADDKNPLEGDGVNIGGFGKEPLFLRGDRITLDAGYRYLDRTLNQWVKDDARIITGYISKVNSGIPVRLEVEDNMWLFKQTPLPNRTWTDSDTLEDIMAWMIAEANRIHGTALTYRALTKTGFGELVVHNETAAQLLNRLQREYGFQSYFRGDELRCGVLVYFADDANTLTFYMNGPRGNVPADGQQLEYQRREDIVLSAVAHNTITEKTGAQTKDGQDKTRRTRLQVLVTIRNGRVTSQVIAKGERAPDATEGERRTLFFPGAQTTDELARLAKEELEKFYYDGLTGTFDTFGIPYVRHGDNVRIINPKQPEQDGLYRVRSVAYTGGNGLRQQVKLHYRVNA